MAAVHDLKPAAGALAVAGLRIDRMLSSALFLESDGNPQDRSGLVPFVCQRRWIDLAAALAALPQPLEGLLVLSAVPPAGGGAHEVVLAFLVIGRGARPAEARAAALAGLPVLRTLLTTTLDYAELRTIDEPAELALALAGLAGPHVLEFRRRCEPVTISHGLVSPTIPGFRTSGTAAKPTSKRGAVTLRALFPWPASDDPWRRLLEALRESEGPCAMAVHFRGFDVAPAAALGEADAVLAETEKLLAHGSQDAAGAHAVFYSATDAMRREAMTRAALLRGAVLAARVFLAGRAPASPALMATLRNALDDPSLTVEQPAARALFHGGADVREVAAAEPLAPLDAPALEELFGAQEAATVLRTPMPVDLEMPGLGTNRARTAAIVGRSGDDAPLGLNVHRAERRPVALDEPTRFRHTYLVGQTGTGKSTLLLHMILHDIRAGRGVGVLDPHGSLVQDVLLRVPDERVKDVVLVDVADTEHPIGFNVLRIEEQDPVRYHEQCDLVIDDLQSFMDRTYLREHMGPMFESHFHNMLKLLLGSEPQQPPLIPSLMILRTCYNNAALRGHLCARMKGRDPVLDDFIVEVSRSTGDYSFANMAQWITAKFNRFISDQALRNITCQHDILDLGEIVNEGKILLFYLGKGRFGDQAAGLLAGQVVSRIRTEVMKRGAGGAARPFFLYADEFHLFANERFGELLSEARKFGLALTLAHQFVHQLPAEVAQAVLGNVGTLIAFRSGAPDAKALEPEFVPALQCSDLMSLPNFRAYVKTVGDPGLTPFSIETLPAPDGADPRRAERIRAASRTRYGRPREAVEQEINDTYRAYASFRPSPDSTK